MARAFLAKKEFLHQHLPKVLLLLFAIIFFSYTSIRANVLSMTHDESGSYIYWLDFNIFSCFIDPICWSSANLHFLYVFLMKITVGIFGNSECAIRLPSLLGHLVYLFFSWKLVNAWSGRPWLILAGFIIININPYLLDFFSLARGYGLAMTFLMMGLYYLGEFIKKPGKKAIWGMFIGAWFSIFSNFSMLNFYASLIAVLILFYLINHKKNISVNIWKRLLYVAVISSAMLALVLYMPLTTLSKEGEFLYGAKTFWETIKSLTAISLYEVRYINKYQLEIVSAIYLALLLIGFFIFLKRFIRFPYKPSNQFGMALFLFIILVSLASVIQHYLLGVNYLKGRKALIYIPLVTTALFLFFEHILPEKSISWQLALPLIITLFSIVHAFRGFQIKKTSTWGYDSETKAMLYYLENKTPTGEKIKLGLHWFFHPTSFFYSKTIPFDFMEDLVYQKEYRKDDYYDYYYIRPSDIVKINKAYEIEKRFSKHGLLMVRKD